MHRPDQTLFLAGIAERPPSGCKPAREGGIGDETFGPDPCYEFFLWDDALGILDDVGEQFEHLRLDVDRAAVVPKFEGSRVELKSGESVIHGS